MWAFRKSYGFPSLPPSYVFPFPFLFLLRREQGRLVMPTSTDLLYSLTSDEKGSHAAKLGSPLPWALLCKPVDVGEEAKECGNGSDEHPGVDATCDDADTKPNMTWGRRRGELDQSGDGIVPGGLRLVRQRPRPRQGHLHLHYINVCLSKPPLFSFFGSLINFLRWLICGWLESHRINLDVMVYVFPCLRLPLETLAAAISS